MRRQGTEPERSEGTHGGIECAVALALLLLASSASAADAVSAVVVLRWDEVPDASGYELQIARDAQCTNVVVSERTVTAGYRWKSLPAATHYWRVRSLDSTGRPGPWSAVKQVGARVEAPRLLSPENGAAATCRPSCGFDVALAPDPLIQSFVIEWHQGAAEGKVQLSGVTGRVELPAAGTVRWRAGGVDLAGRAAPFSEERQVEVLAPAPVLAATDEELAAALPRALHLSWSARPEDGAYALELGTPGRRMKTLTAAGAAIDVSLDAYGTWAVRVMATGVKSEWSAWREVRVRAPSPMLVLPADRTSLSSRGPARHVSFEWKGNSPRYVVQFAKEGSFDAPVEQTVEGNTAKIPVPLGTSFWRVVGVDAAGTRSAPSASQSLEVVGVPALAAPVVRAPEQKTRIVSGPVALSWEPVADARGYELEWLGEPARRQSTLETALTVALEEGEHPFRVRALDEEGAPGDWSEQRTFFVGPARTEQAKLALPLFALDSGEQVTIRLRLLDREGAKVNGAPVVVRADVGAAELVGPTADGYEVRYRAPEVERDRTATLEISDRGFVRAERIPVRTLRRPLRLSLEAGYGTNGGALGSPTAQAEVSGRLPALDGRLRAAARVGRVASEVALPSSALAASARAELWPLSALAQFEQPFSALSLTASLGPQLQYASVGVLDEYQRTWSLGAVGSVGALRRLGPGAVAVELSLSTGQVSGELAHFRSGLFTLTAGYAWEP